MIKRVQEVFGLRMKPSSEYTAVILISLLVFLIGFSAASLFAKAISTQNAADYDSRLSQQALSIQSHTASTVGTYDRLLYAAAALFNAHGDVTRSEWQQFYDDMRVPEQYRSLLGLGYVTYLLPDQVAGFEQNIRAEGFPEFSVTPTNARDEYTAITYIEPFDSINQRAFGYDMFADQVRRAAMAEARDSARPTMSSPVKLVQDLDKKDDNLGVLIYYPVYTTDTIPATIKDRRAALKGYVYVVFRPGDILSRYAEQSPRFDDSTDINLYDLDISGQTALYSVDSSSTPIEKQRKFTEFVEVDSRRWGISVGGQDEALNRFFGPIGIFTMGAVISSIAAVFVYALLMSRIAKVEQNYEVEVQKTKDELLALASHQLRTPASGVKQYIGMLTSGITGELNSMQRSVAEKAYEANERQLHIINELLYVSKVDAGQLLIEPVEVDLSRVSTRVIDTFNEQAAVKDIELVSRFKRPRIVMADDRYVSMIVENLVSNAIKYSYPSSTVQIQLKDAGKMVALVIRDNGVGIAARDYERVFNKFDRVENPLSHTEGGSGLGLFLARQLARAHGGDITVVSRLGKGSAFTLTLPKDSTINRAYVNLRATHRDKKGRTKR